MSGMLFGMFRLMMLLFEMLLRYLISVCSELLCVVISICLLVCIVGVIDLFYSGSMCVIVFFRYLVSGSCLCGIFV